MKRFCTAANPATTLFNIIASNVAKCIFLRAQLFQTSPSGSIYYHRSRMGMNHISVPDQRVEIWIIDVPKQTDIERRPGDKEMRTLSVSVLCRLKLSEISHFCLPTHVHLLYENADVMYVLHWLSFINNKVMLNWGKHERDMCSNPLINYLCFHWLLETYGTHKTQFFIHC